MLAIIDPFKPCPGTVDGINFANLRRWMSCRNSSSVFSPAPLFAKLSRGSTLRDGPHGGRFERNKFRKSIYRILMSTLHVGEGIMLLLKCCIASWLASVGPTFPERPSGRFAKFIPSTVWSLLVEYLSWVGEVVEAATRRPFPADKDEAFCLFCRDARDAVGTRLGARLGTRVKT